MNWTTQHIDGIVESYRQTILDTICRLVRIPSENIAPRGYEKRAQLFLAELLNNYGFKIDLFTPQEVNGLTDHPAFFPGREYHDRPNLVTRLRGKGGGPSIIFSAHVDTVTAGNSPWKWDTPFSGKLHEGRIYGRGAFDMKGGLVAALFAVAIIKDQELSLRGDVLFESVVDEENGGSNGTLASRVRGYNADVAIIPEPTLFTVCPAARGGRYYRISVGGSGGTGFADEILDNPIYGMADLVQGVAAFDRHITKQRPSDPLFASHPRPRDVILDKIQAGDLDPGGNIGIPSEGWFSVYITTLPGCDEGDLDREFTDFLRNHLESSSSSPVFTPRFSHLTRYLYPFRSDPAHPVVDFMCQGVKTFVSLPGVLEGARFACDGFIFKKYFDTETYVLGPRGGNAHTVNEYVEADDVVSLTKVFLWTALNWCG